MKRILIYDVEHSVCDELRQLLMNILSPDECSIMTVLDHTQAEEYLRTGVDLVFLDIVLSDDADGIEFAKRIRRNHRDVKIIFITAHIRYCEEIFEVLPDGFLVKPFTAGKVERSLNIILKRSVRQQEDIVIKSSKSSIRRIPAGVFFCAAITAFP